MSWKIKLSISILIDLFDMAVGRALFAIPFSGEVIGVIAGMLMFGPKGLYLHGVIHQAANDIQNTPPAVYLKCFQ